MQLNCKVMKKWQPPFSGLPHLSNKMFGTPQVTKFLEGPPPPFFNKEGGFQLGRASEDGCEE